MLADTLRGIGHNKGETFEPSLATFKRTFDDFPIPYEGWCRRQRLRGKGFCGAGNTVRCEKTGASL